VPPVPVPVPPGPQPIPVPNPRVPAPLRRPAPRMTDHQVVENMNSIGAWDMKKISKLTPAERRGLLSRYRRQARWYGYERSIQNYRRGSETIHGCQHHGVRVMAKVAGVHGDQPVVQLRAWNEARSAVFQEAVKPLTEVPGVGVEDFELNVRNLEEMGRKVIGTTQKVALAPARKALNLLPLGVNRMVGALRYTTYHAWQLVPDAIRQSAVKRLVPCHLQPDTMRAARGLDSILRNTRLPVGRSISDYGIQPDCTEYYVAGKSKDEADCSYRVEKVTVGSRFAKQSLYVCPDLVAYLRVYAGTDERTTALLRMLKGRAIVWAKERSINYTDLHRFLIPSITTAMVMKDTGEYWPALTIEARRTIELCSSVARGEQPSVALWRWWDLLSFNIGLKAAFLEMWDEWVLPRPSIPVKSFRESFL